MKPRRVTEEWPVHCIGRVKCGMSICNHYNAHIPHEGKGCLGPKQVSWCRIIDAFVTDIRIDSESTNPNEAFKILKNGGSIV